MQSQGFKLRFFSSIDEYLAQKRVASMWYFTRLQLERMGEHLLRNLQRIQNSVIFTKDHLPRVKDGTAFYHPLPRNKAQPVIPSFLDDTPLNQWDLQSANGYHVRFALLGMLAGAIGEDFEGMQATPEDFSSDFITDVTEAPAAGCTSKPLQNFGIKPIENGTVIDHIAAGQSIRSIWNIIDVIRRTLRFDQISSHGVFSSIKHKRFKGIISIPDYSIDRLTELKKIGAISSGCTVNVIQNSKVVKKLRITQPNRIYNFEEIHCRNSQCISHPSHNEPIYADFHKTGPANDDVYLCRYCETPHRVNEIWNF